MARGRLPNGVRYYVRQNAQPASQTSVRLVVQVGSLREEEGEAPAVAAPSDGPSRDAACRGVNVQYSVTSSDHNVLRRRRKTARRGTSFLGDVEYKK